MNKPTGNTAQDHRQDRRIGMTETVTVHLDGAAIVGPGQNISTQGLFFVTESSIPVTVRVGNAETPVRGELIRVQAMGEGRLGIAVRFLEWQPEQPPA